MKLFTTALFLAYALAAVAVPVSYGKLLVLLKLHWINPW